MYCDVCHLEAEKTMELLGSSVCENCFYKIANISVACDEYDYYKEIVKSLLKNYKYERPIVNPVE
ncbi:MAG: hypothetical protein GX080_01510 [Tissierellia bacterium]|nr:hypothetical protein [Tissierellia bacterium]